MPPTVCFDWRNYIPSSGRRCYCLGNFFYADLSPKRYWSGSRFQDEGKEEDSTYRYTVIIRMTLALKWGATRAILPRPPSPSSSPLLPMRRLLLLLVFYRCFVCSSVGSECVSSHAGTCDIWQLQSYCRPLPAMSISSFSFHQLFPALEPPAEFHLRHNQQRHPCAD